MRQGTLERNTGPRRFVSRDFSHASTVSSPNGSVSAFAALFTTMSSRPNWATVRSTRVDGVDVAHVGGDADGIAATVRRCAWVSAQASGFRLATATLAPRGSPSAIESDTAGASGDYRHPAGQVVQPPELSGHQPPFVSDTTLL